MIWSELTQPTSIWRDNAKKAMAEDYTVNNANNVIEVKQGYDNQAVDKEWKKPLFLRPQNPTRGQNEIYSLCNLSFNFITFHLINELIL